MRDLGSSPPPHLWAIRGVVGAAFGVSMALCAGCAESTTPPKATRTLAYAVHGCVAWYEARCEFRENHPLTVWAAVRGQPVEAWAEGERLATATATVGDGLRLEIHVPSTARTLELRTASARADVPLTFVKTSTPTDRVRADVYAALARAKRAIRRGQPEHAHQQLPNVATAALTVGDRYAANQAEHLLVYIEAALLGDLEAARRRMNALAPPDPRQGEMLALHHYHHGLVASLGIDIRSALTALREAERWGRRVGAQVAIAAANERARVLMEAGRAHEAARILDGLLRTRLPVDDCYRAAVLATASWARIVARPPREPERARRQSQRAQAIYETTCANPREANNVRVSLAFLAAATAPRHARALLAEIHGPERPESRLWRLVLQAHLARADGRLPDARRAYDDVQSEARRLSNDSAEWQASVGLGAVAEAAGDLSKATGHYAAAERILDRHTLAVPVTEGQYFLLEDRKESQRRLVQTLLKLDRPFDAFEAARRARRRAVLMLAARDALERLPEHRKAAWLAALAHFRRARAKVQAATAQQWQSAQSERARVASATAEAARSAQRALDAALAIVSPRGVSRSPPPLKDPKTLAILPYALLDEPIVFVARGTRVRVIRIPSTATATIWRSALQPERIGAQRIRVMADPAAPMAQQLAQALETDLLAAFTLDLDPWVPDAPPAARHAAIVFDPRGDLTHARVEGAWVASSLERSGFPTKVLGPVAATPPRVVELIRGAHLFHFAGHGRHQGAEGWKSALILRDGELGLGDLLTLDPPPRWAVLTGCETAKVTQSSVSAGIGLGQVLLAAGTAAVVATTARVPSRDAFRFAQRFYAAFGGGQDFERAYRVARKPGSPFVLITRSL
ncbi:MAG: CHAT domain-containing protein [Myxococcota bacterium]